MTAVQDRLGQGGSDPSTGSSRGAGGGDDRRSAGAIMVVGFLALTGLLLSVAAFAVSRSNGGGGGAGTSSEPVIANISLQEFSITGDLEVPPGNVVLRVRNDGNMVHNLAVRGGVRTADLQPGQSADLELRGLLNGTYELICTIAGHEASGMKAELVVRDGAVVAGGEGEAAAGGHGDGLDFAAMDAAMKESILQFPAATEGTGNQVMEPTIAADGAKEFELTAAIIDWEVEPGKFVQAWTYNGTVPGPVINVDLGDKVRVIVHNELPMGTDLHLHGVRGKPNSMDGVAPITQDIIEPGESFTYEFEAKYRAVGMYHAHHHGQMQVINGMLGAIMIGQDSLLPRGRTISGTEIPADLVVDQEVPMVLNDSGSIGLSLNGKSFPATAPVVAKVDDWVVVHYMNEGLQSHPMHAHQFPQLVYAKDGIPLDEPYWADTINVAPGERYSVLMHIDNPGTWVWHCHILNHVERETGMFGMVTAIVAQET